MKRYLIYTAIVMGVLVAGFLIIVIGTVIIADNDQELDQYSYTVGYAFGMLVMVFSGGALIFGMFKLTVMVFFRKEEVHEDDVLDKDGPIDRYLK